MSSALSGVAEGTKERFLDKSGLNGAVTPIVENTLKEKSKVDGNIGTIFEHLLENPNKREAWYAGNKIVSGEVLDLAIRKISYNIRDYIEEAVSSEKPIASRFRMDAPSLEVLERVKNAVEYGGYDVIKTGDYIDLGTTIPGTPSMRFYVMGVDTFGTKPCIDFVSFDYPNKFQANKISVDKYKLSPTFINALVYLEVFNNKRLAELHEALKKEYISNKSISVFGDDNKPKNDFTIWTLDLSHVLGSPILLLAGGSVETTGILPYPLFQKEKFVKALGKGSFITSTTTVNNINIVDLEGYIGSMTKEEAFLEIPEGPNKEAELKKRPIIPICFRIAKTGN